MCHSQDRKVWFRLREVLTVTYWVGQSNESKQSEEKQAESDRSIEVEAKRWRHRAITQLSITPLHFYLLTLQLTHCLVTNTKHKYWIKMKT